MLNYQRVIMGIYPFLNYDGDNGEKYDGIIS